MVSRGAWLGVLALLALFLSAPALAGPEEYGVFIAPTGTGPKDPAGPAALGLADSLAKQGLVQKTVSVGSRAGFEDTMRGLARAGRKVDVLVIAGHGARGDPGISFGEGLEGGIGARDLDLGSLRRDLENARLGRDRQKALGQPTAQQDSEILQIRQRIRDIKALGEAMNPGARILLINCDTGSDPRGERFIQDLGFALLPHGGRVIASRVRTAVTDQSGWDMLLQRLDTFARNLWSGKQGYDAGGHIVSGDFEFYDFGPRPLTLEVEASETEVEPGQAVTLTATCEDGRGARHLLWTRTATGQTWQDQDRVQVQCDRPGTEEIHVEAWDDLSPRPAAVQEFVSIEVVALEVEVAGPTEVGVGEPVSLRATTRGFRTPWHEWKSDEGWNATGEDPAATTTFRSPGRHSVTLRVFDWNNPRRARVVSVPIVVTPARDPAREPSLEGQWIQESPTTGARRTVTFTLDQGKPVMQYGPHRAPGSGNGKSYTFTFPIRTVQDFGMIHWHDSPPPAEILEAAAGRGLRIVYAMTVVSPDEMKGTVTGIRLNWEGSQLTEASNGYGPFPTVWRRERRAAPPAPGR